MGQLPLDQDATPSLPPIPTPVAATATPTPSPEESVEPSATAEPTPVVTPVPVTGTAIQLQADSVGINVAVQRLQAGQPLGDCCAYLLPNTSEPGRGTNSYIAGHALNTLLKGLWNIQLGAEIRVLMSDGVVLRYTVTEVRPNVSCPDPDAPPMDPPIPLALLYAPPGCAEGARWTLPTDHEQLTLQTSQGFNRNWGELIVIALPIQDPS
ncbi:MAG TPA: sortase [Candidatus Limnocylindria bacterium]